MIHKPRIHSVGFDTSMIRVNRHIPRGLHIRWLVDWFRVLLVSSMRERNPPIYGLYVFRRKVFPTRHCVGSSFLIELGRNITAIKHVEGSLQLFRTSYTLHPLGGSGFIIWSIHSGRCWLLAELHYTSNGMVQTSTLLTKQSIRFDTAPRLAIEKKADARAVLSLLLLLLLLLLLSSSSSSLLSRSFIFFMTCLVVKSFLIIVSPDKVFNNNNNCCEICHSNTSDRDFSLFVSCIFVCTRAETFPWEDKNSYFKANFSPLSLIVKLFGRLCYM